MEHTRLHLDCILERLLVPSGRAVPIADWRSVVSCPWRAHSCRCRSRCLSLVLTAADREGSQAGPLKQGRSGRAVIVLNGNWYGLEGVDRAPPSPSSAAIKGCSDLIEPSVARADSRVANPCPLQRRFGQRLSPRKCCILNTQSQRRPS
jgi:hypothetical protein